MLNISKSGLLDILWHTMTTRAPVGANKENRKKGRKISFNPLTSSPASAFNQNGKFYCINVSSSPCLFPSLQLSVGCLSFL